jgi:protein-tyrosine phosphatase
MLSTYQNSQCSGPDEMSAITLKQLARSLNLRDLGGLSTKAGRSVRRGFLYRSGALAQLSAAQIAAIRVLEIRSVVDLRSNGERAIHPTPWEDIGCRHYFHRDHHPSGGGDLNEILSDESLTAPAAHALMIRVYERLAFEHIEVLRRLFQTVATGEGPFLFHCTAGKDRTGVAAALILSALEVPREAILADYLASAEFDILSSPAFIRDEPLSPERLEALRPIYTADGDYLDAMFDAIAARDGSVERFFSRALELDASVLDDLRARLLEA